MKLCEALQKLQAELPAVFAGTSLDMLTGNGYRWRSLQNEKSQGLVPEDVFLRSGERKLLVVRDNFLPFWQKKIDGKAETRASDKSSHIRIKPKLPNRG